MILVKTLPVFLNTESRGADVDGEKLVSSLLAGEELPWRADGLGGTGGATSDNNVVDIFVLHARVKQHLRHPKGFERVAEGRAIHFGGERAGMVVVRASGRTG